MQAVTTLPQPLLIDRKTSISIMTMMTTPCEFGARSVWNMDISCTSSLYIYFLKSHVQFFKALVNELAGVNLPFDEDYFVPIVYDFVIRVADLHVLCCSNSSNVLIPRETELSQADESRESIHPSHPSATILADAAQQASGAAKDSNFSSVIHNRDQPVNNYLDFNAHQFEMKFDIKKNEFIPFVQNNTYHIEAASLDVSLLLSRFHSIWMKCPAMNDLQKSSFIHPAFSIHTLLHTTNDDSLTDWYEFHQSEYLYHCNFEFLAASRLKYFPPTLLFLHSVYLFAIF
jgi:hypothetical protein